MVDYNSDGHPEITIKLVISDKLLADIIVVAVEGGINYWADVVTYKWTEGPEHTRAEIVDSEGDGKHYTITPTVIAEGLSKILANPEFQIRKDILEDIYQGTVSDDAGHIDSTAADCIVQAGLFGELVFG